jgi:DNA-binding transcriptional LysR family regulator
VIDPRRLRVLRALADEGTVTAAAHALFLTPSAVSQQLAALESEVGQPILHHTGRRVELTPAGRILLAHANAILAELERAEAALAAHAKGLGGQLTVAAFATAISLVVAPAIASLRLAAPGLQVLVRDSEGQDSLPLLLRGEIDVAVADAQPHALPVPDWDQRLVTSPLYSEPFDVALPADHRLASASAQDVRLADLVGERWIGPYPGNPCHEMIATACAHAGVEVSYAHHSDDFRAVAALVSAGAGVALIPRHALSGVERPGLLLRPLAGTAPERRVFAAMRRGAESRPAIAALLTELTKASLQKN